MAVASRRRHSEPAFASSSSVKTPTGAGLFHRSSDPRPVRSAPAPGGHARVQRRTCTCSPTSHPGSFRCSLHKGIGTGSSSGLVSGCSPNRRSAMTNSLVRIGGDVVRRALAALIRPSSHQQRRRGAFRPRRSRLSAMSRAEET